MVRIEQRPVLCAVGADTAEARATEINAVVALDAADELRLARASRLAPIGPGDFQRGIGTFRPGVGEEHMG